MMHLIKREIITSIDFTHFSYFYLYIWLHNTIHFCFSDITTLASGHLVCVSPHLIQWDVFRPLCLS